MPEPRAVTVTFTGPQGSGKTRTANMLRDALAQVGAVCVASDANADASLWRFDGMMIHILEKQV